MDILMYLSIISKIYTIVAGVFLIFLIVGFIRNIGFSKYLTKEDINELYNYNWSEYEVESLNILLLSRKKLIKLISIIMVSLVFTNALTISISNSRFKNVDNVGKLLNTMYCNDISNIDNDLKNLDFISKDLYEKLSANNIDNIEDRYSGITSKDNNIRILNSYTVADEQTVNYQIINSGVVISNRTTTIKYIDGKIGKFDESILVPVDYVDNVLDEKPSTKENNLESNEVEGNKTSESSNNPVDKMEDGNLSADDF